jgi:hypothetical protein
MTDSTRPTRPSVETCEAERAQPKHEADRVPTLEEEEAVAKHVASPEVARHEDGMLKRGANQQGEGRLP